VVTKLGDAPVDQTNRERCHDEANCIDRTFWQPQFIGGSEDETTFYGPVATLCDYLQSPLGEWDDSYLWSTDGFWGRDGSWHYFDDVYHNHEQCHSSSYYGGGGYYPSYYYYPTYYYGYDGVDYHGLRRFGGW